MNKIILVLALLLSVYCYPQAANNYKYIIMPERFEFQKTSNQYNINTLVKKLFEKYGFEVYYATDQLPAEVALDRCSALYADLVKTSGFLDTRMTFYLKDCKGVEVFKSFTGRSKEKDYQKAYYEAIRDASHSLDNLNYTYTGNKIKQKNEVATTAAPVQKQPAIVKYTARQIPGGYELTGQDNRDNLKMRKTSQADSYSAQSDTKNGVVFRKGNEWFFEYYQNDVLVTEKLDITFTE